MCGALWGVQGSSRVGARVRAAGEATCRATYIPSPHVSMGDSSPKMPVVTSSSSLDAQAELQDKARSYIPRKSSAPAPRRL